MIVWKGSELIELGIVGVFVLAFIIYLVYCKISYEREQRKKGRK